MVSLVKNSWRGRVFVNAYEIAARRRLQKGPMAVMVPKVLNPGP